MSDKTHDISVRVVPPNPPGRDSLAYRSGTRPQILRRMLDRLRTQGLAGKGDGLQVRPLAALTTQDSADPAIALLDAWAGVLDVLTFYQERIANEGFLRTAVERRSLVELASQSGYAPSPGLAASVSLAFEVQTVPGMPESLLLESGIQVMSLPVSGQLPQTFETVEALPARPEWNTLDVVVKPLAAKPALGPQARSLELEGVNSGLRAGDSVLLVLDGAPHVLTLEKVELQRTQGFTRISWAMRSAAPDGAGSESSSIELYALTGSAKLFGHDAPEWKTKTALYRYSAEDGAQPIDHNLYDLQVTCLAAATPAGTLFAGTVEAGVYRSTDDGQRWSACRQGMHHARVYALYSAPDGSLFAGCDDGVIYRSTDLGDNWTQIAQGTVVVRIETDTQGNKEVELQPPALPKEPIKALAGVVKNGKLELAAGTDSGLYVSDDNGKNWQSYLIDEGVSALTPSDGPEDSIFIGSPFGRLRIYLSQPDQTPMLYEPPIADLDGPILGLAMEPGSGELLAAQGTYIWRRTEMQEGYQWEKVLDAPTAPIRAMFAGQGNVFFTTPPPEDQITSEWPGMQLRPAQFDLDRSFPDLATGGWVALTNPHVGPVALPLRIKKATTLYREDFSLSARVTRLSLGSTPKELADYGGSRLRETRVLLASGPLPLHAGGRLPDSWPQSAQMQVEFDRPIPPLPPGRRIILSGKPTDREGQIGEVAFVTGMDAAKQLRLTKPLQHKYDPSQPIRIHANVALATHGESVSGEVLGSGDSARVNQRFKLARTPLTYLPKSQGAGAQTSLQVRVNGILWRKVASLHNQAADDQVYVLHQDSQGASYVIFGDGQCGARLPSGSENVTADYRYGLGLTGNVAAQSLTILQKRPMGVVSVINPLPASGGADPETGARLRTNIPLTVQTMDRIVSLSDYENFVRSFPGVGKALSALLWTGDANLVHLTIAGQDGGPIEQGSALYAALLQAIDSRRNRYELMQIDSYERVLFQVSARLYRDSRYLQSAVEEAVIQALRKAFSFENRLFGQPVMQSEVIAVIQHTPGVVAVDLDRLAYALPATDLHEGRLLDQLPARGARYDASAARVTTGGRRPVLPAELLLLDPDESGVQLRTEVVQ